MKETIKLHCSKSGTLVLYMNNIAMMSLYRAIETLKQTSEIAKETGMS